MQTTVEKLFADILDVKPVHVIENSSSFTDILPFLFLKFLKLFGDETSLQSIALNESIIFRLDPQKTNGIDGWFTIQTLPGKIWFCIHFFPDTNYPQKMKNGLPLTFLTIQTGYWRKGSEGRTAITNKNALTNSLPNIKYSVREDIGMIAKETSRFIDIKLFLLKEIIQTEVLPYASWVKQKQELFTMNSSVLV